MKTPGKGKVPPGPSQRQLRTGELVRHGLVDVLRETEVNDADLKGVSVTISEARMTADLKQANVFAAPLGSQNVDAVIVALNRHAKFLRGELARRVDLRFIPELRFRRDESFEAAARLDAVFNDPKVRQDLDRDEPAGGYGAS